MNHVAFNVPENRLREYRKRLTSSPLSSFVSPIMYHADSTEGVATNRTDPRVTWASIYFFGPDGELLELSSQADDADFHNRAKHVTHLPQKALWRIPRKNSKL